MPIIASGASAAITISKGYMLALAAGAQGMVSFAAGPQGGQSLPINGQAMTLGPFAGDQVAYVSSTVGQLPYSLQRADGMVFSKVPASAFQISPLILEQNHATGTPLTGTLTETVLASILIPGGIIGKTGSVRMRAVASMTNNANNKTVNFKIGAVLLAGAAAASNTTTIVSNIMANRGSLASQVNTNPLTSGATATFTATTIDTSVDQILTITGTLANTGDTMTLESYVVEVLPG
jgi:hypothetical protein